MNNMETPEIESISPTETTQMTWDGVAKCIQYHLISSINIYDIWGILRSHIFSMLPIQSAEPAKR